MAWGCFRSFFFEKVVKNFLIEFRFSVDRIGVWLFFSLIVVGCVFGVDRIRSDGLGVFYIYFFRILERI